MTEGATQPASRRALILALILASIALSSYKAARIAFSGLLIHPYLIPMFGLFFGSCMQELRRFPRDVMFGIVIFILTYFVSAIPAPGLLGEMLKVFAAFATVFCCALCVQGLRDFWAAVLGLNVATAVMTIRGLVAGVITYTGYNPLAEVANKNAFSLYALPSILLGMFVALDRRAPKWLRLALAANVAMTAFSIFSSANRSGWVGVIMIAVAFTVRGQRGRRGTAAMLFLGALVYVLLMRYGSTETFEYKVQQTERGYSSDQRRETLFLTAIEVGLDHPLVGVSPQLLPVVLAQRTHAREPMLDPHNVLGHVLGGSGIFCAASFLFLGWSAWKKPKLQVRKRSSASYSTQLLRLQILLFLVRGLFSREILYNPSFAAGFGLCIGLCLVEYGAVAAGASRATVERTPAAASALPAPAARAP